MRPTLIDTGPLVAVLSKSQQHHHACCDSLARLSLPLLTCWPVLVEAAYLLRHRHDVVNLLLNSAHSGFLQILPLEDRDIPRIIGIRDKYRDLGLDLADASLMALSEREGITSVFTLDSDFRVFKPAHVDTLELIQVHGLNL